MEHPWNRWLSMASTPTITPKPWSTYCYRKWIGVYSAWLILLLYMSPPFFFFTLSLHKRTLTFSGCGSAALAGEAVALLCPLSWNVSTLIWNKSEQVTQVNLCRRAEKICTKCKSCSTLCTVQGEKLSVSTCSRPSLRSVPQWAASSWQRMELRVSPAFALEYDHFLEQICLSFNEL